MDTHNTQLTILGNSGGMYPESLDLHAAGPLHQCYSLEGLDRYLLRGSVCVCVCLFLVWSSAFFGLGD